MNSSIKTSIQGGNFIKIYDKWEGNCLRALQGFSDQEIKYLLLDALVKSNALRIGK